MNKKPDSVHLLSLYKDSSKTSDGQIICQDVRLSDQTNMKVWTDVCSLQPDVVEKPEEDANRQLIDFLSGERHANNDEDANDDAKSVLQPIRVRDDAVSEAPVSADLAGLANLLFDGNDIPSQMPSTLAAAVEETENGAEEGEEEQQQQQQQQQQQEEKAGRKKRRQRPSLKSAAAAALRTWAAAFR